MWTGWSYVDAINLAIDCYNRGEVKLNDLDKLATKIWKEIQSELNEPVPAGTC